MIGKLTKETEIRVDELKKLMRSSAWSTDDWGVDYIYKSAIKRRIKRLRDTDGNRWIIKGRR